MMNEDTKQLSVGFSATTIMLLGGLLILSSCNQEQRRLVCVQKAQTADTAIHCNNVYTQELWNRFLRPSK